jgi:adenylylsulfate kinase
MIYWYIGQPGCGKTTLAKLHQKYFYDGGSRVIHLDGDDLRKIFSTSYKDKENFTKEYRIEQTRILQKMVAYIADQGFNIIISTVNPYREVREEFKKSRKDVKEIYVTTSDVRGRESYWVKDFEEPLDNFTSAVTGNGKTPFEVLQNLKWNL